MSQGSKRIGEGAGAGALPADSRHGGWTRTADGDVRRRKFGQGVYSKKNRWAGSLVGQSKPTGCPIMLPSSFYLPRPPTRHPENIDQIINEIIPIEEVITMVRQESGLPPLTEQDGNFISHNLQWIVVDEDDIQIRILPRLYPVKSKQVSPSVIFHGEYIGTPQQHRRIAETYFNLRPEHIEAYLARVYGWKDARLIPFSYHKDLTGTFILDEMTSDKVFAMVQDMDTYVKFHKIRSVRAPITRRPKQQQQQQKKKQEQQQMAAVLEYIRTMNPDLFAQMVGGDNKLVTKIDTKKRIQQLQKLQKLL
jgi:hypothetical protein